MTKEQLLAKARRDYPIGTKFKPAHGYACDEPDIVFTVSSTEFGEMNANGISSLTKTGKRFGGDETEGDASFLDRVVYSEQHGWAEIVRHTKQSINSTMNKKETKNYFSEFKYKGRLITLVLVHNKVDLTLSAGYSVKVKGDKKDKDLGRKIALGRAQSSKTNLLPNQPAISTEILNKFVAQAILGSLEHRISNNNITIKGIK